MKFDILLDNYETYLAAPRICGRCQRAFQAGERVRMVVSGVVESTRPLQSYALVNQRHARQWWEHENVARCAEPR